MKIRNYGLLLKQFAGVIEEEAIKNWIAHSPYKFSEVHYSKQFAVLETDTAVADNVRIIIDQGNVQYLFNSNIDVSLVKDFVNGILNNSEYIDDLKFTWSFHADVFLDKGHELTNLNYLFKKVSDHINHQFIGFQYSSSQIYKVGVNLRKKNYKCNIRTDFESQEINSLDDFIDSILVDVEKGLVPEIYALLEGDINVD